MENENKNFISKKVNPILEKMVVEILIKKPDNCVSFMIDWLSANRDKLVEDISSPLKKHKKKTPYGESSEEDEDETEEPEMMSKEDLKQKFNAKATIKNGRTSVSAEAYGNWNKKGNFKPKVIKKTTNQVNRIKSRISQSFIFSALEEKEIGIVIDAMEEKTFKNGDKIIVQGDDGDNLYIVDDGVLDCHKSFFKGEMPKLIKKYFPGDSFGELALLYNAPRAATIISSSDCVLFALDRETFNHIVKDAASKKREKYESFLNNIELLDTMKPYERTQIADALKPMKFDKGDYVVKEGERGNTFFFIEKGEAIATKVLHQGKAPETVYSYKQGDYFGELALLRDTPRAASIVALSDLQIVALDRLSFKRMLGPLEDILERNFSRYEKYINK